MRGQLVVHAVVVLLPLSAVGAVVVAAWPRARRRWGQRGPGGVGERPVRAAGAGGPAGLTRPRRPGPDARVHGGRSPRGGGPCGTGAARRGAGRSVLPEQGSPSTEEHPWTAQ